MKRLLMIVPFFPPMAGGGVYRPLAFVRYLARYGWEPTVIAPDGDAYWIRDERLVARVPDGVRVVRTPSLSGQAVLARMRPGRGGARPAQRRSSRGFGFLRRAASGALLPDTYIGWYPAAVRAGRRLLREQRFDALYSTSPPETSHLIGRRLQRACGIPWVADFRDPWMNLYLLAPPSRVHRRIHERMEASVCGAATAVVVTTHWHESLLAERYPGVRVARICNGYDGEEVDGNTAGPGGGGVLRIMHAGMLTQTRTAVPFLEGLARFLEADPAARDRIAVTFAGPREDENDVAAVRLGLGDVVTFRASIPHDDALREQGASHILLLIKHDNPLYQGLVPGKLFEYIGLRRPILAVGPPGEAVETVARLRRGETADPRRPDEIASAIARLYSAWREGTLETGYDLTPRPEFDRARLTGELAALLDSVQ